MIKKYKALLIQENENDPSAIILNGDDVDFLGNIVWSRDSAGIYFGALSGSFDYSKIWPDIKQTYGGGTAILSAYSSLSQGTGDLNIVIESKTFNTYPSPNFYLNDNAIYYTPIEIIVYE